jgi:hypothetical protein
MGKRVDRPQSNRTTVEKQADLFVTYLNIRSQRRISFKENTMEEGLDLVVATLENMGLAVLPMHTILIDKGYFVGHKYRIEGGYALRKVGTSVIEIYDDGDKLLSTVSLAENQRSAA